MESTKMKEGTIAKIGGLSGIAISLLMTGLRILHLPIFGALAVTLSLSLLIFLLYAWINQRA